MTQAQNYSAERAPVDGVEVVRLIGPAARASILPSAGNMAFEMLVNGANLFWWPYKSPAEFIAKPGFAGNPLLAPWANRLDEDAFYANGKRYALNPSLGNIRRDPFRHPIHGFLSYVPWEVVDAGGDSRSAWVTSRLEVWKNPDWMAQFPFAHTLTMTYRLRDTTLETELTVENHSTAPMPLSIGFHPYFEIRDAPRDEWTAHVAATRHVTLSDELIPTGEETPSSLPDPFPLRGGQLDDVFTGLVRDSAGRATFWVKGAKQKISVVYGPQYHVAVVYAPPGRNFICFEPMTAATNAMNLAHRDPSKPVPYVQPGGRWRESFWIVAEGF